MSVLIKFRSFIPLLLAFFLLQACKSTADEDYDEKLIIYTSIYPLSYLATEIAGDYASVQSVIPAGVDAHTYEPTSKEITAIARADAFIFIGGHMESFSETIAKALANENAHLIAMRDYEELFMMNDKVTDDPHIWLDPLRMIEMGEIVTEELSALAPDFAPHFEQNFNRLEESLQSLDESFHTMFAHKSNKEVIVAHAAYGYWEDRYGLEQIAISGISSSDEPSQQELVDIAKLAEAHDLQYILISQTGSNRLTKIMQDQLDANVRTIHDLEVLTEEDMENNEDYMTLMKQNIEVLNEVLR